MDDKKTYRMDSRREMRKRRTVNRFMNIAIGVVAVLILFFAVNLFLQDSEPVADEEDEPVEDENEDELEAEFESDLDEAEDEALSPEETPNLTPDMNEDENDNEENGETENDGDPSAPTGPPEDGDFEPIGTAQEGEFNHDFSEGSQNWQEMTDALAYATGLSESDWTLWRLENAGERSARGVVSDSNNHDQPYEVIMDWVDGEGWMPVEVNQLSSNPY